MAGPALDFRITPDGQDVIVPIGDTTEVWSLPRSGVSLAEMERVTWRLIGSRLEAEGDFEPLSAAELQSLSDH